MPQFFFLWTPEGRVRFATLREKRQRSLRSLQLTAFVAVRFSVRIADGSPGKKATHLRCSDSFHSLLSHFPCRSLRSLGKSATLTALTPTHCAPCCPFFRADRRWLSGQDGGTLAAFVLRQQSQMAGEGCRRIYAACSIRRPEGYWHGAAFDVAAGV